MLYRSFTMLLWLAAGLAGIYAAHLFFMDSGKKGLESDFTITVFAACVIGAKIAQMLSLGLGIDVRGDTPLWKALLWLFFYLLLVLVYTIFKVQHWTGTVVLRALVYYIPGVVVFLFCLNNIRKIDRLKQ